MKLAGVVKRMVARLAPRGWATVMADHGVDLHSVRLEGELRKTLAHIDRTRPGFEDFSLDGKAAITPGKPAQSLLYHALASPNVLPRRAPATAEDFPTLAELDAFENYIYSLARPKLSDFANPVIAVMAYQYRIASRSPHQRHADLAFSRTGIARIGTAPMNYDPIRRSFWMAPPNGGPGIAVMPARYGVFLAELRRPTKTDSIMHPVDEADSRRRFVFPVHKLFPGAECMDRVLVPEFSFVEHHRNDKLRRIHEAPHIPAGKRLELAAGFDRNAAPFVRTSEHLVRLQSVGATTLTVPLEEASLVRLARQFRSTTGKEEIVHFRVRPAETNPNLFDNRFTQSSFALPEKDDAIPAPEYVHIRTLVTDDGLATVNLNDLPDDQYFDLLRKGNYFAAHYIEGSGEGAIAVELSELTELPRLPAYSVLAPPDFLPLVDQLEIQRWVDDNTVTDYFTKGAPTPLCDGRDVPPNPEIRDPLGTGAPAFGGDDGNVTAVVGRAARGNTVRFQMQASRSTSWLPDAAAGVFAPGWDISQSADDDGALFYANYGLGSPFPEDAKLCAALNSFWPAAAPDVGRTFGGFTALPHLDDELGLHPNHSRVRAGGAVSARGWDGEYGPFFEKNGKRINFARVSRSDYTLNAFKGLMRPDLLQQIDALEQIARMEAYRDSVITLHEALGLGRDARRVQSTRLRLVTAEKVVDWGARADRLDATLVGPGYLYVFALPALDVTHVNDFEDELRRGFLMPDPHDSSRLRIKVSTVFVCHMTRSVLACRINRQRLVVKTRPRTRL